MIYLLQAVILIFVQLCMNYLYTSPMAKFQEPIVKGMINYWPVNNPYSAPFHRFGWSMAFRYAILILIIHAIVIVFSYLLGWCSLWMLFTCICTVALCMLWHWKSFDEDMGAYLHNNRFYIGDTSWWDEWLIKHYGQDAGEKKDRLTLELIAAVNLLFIGLNFFIK
jgi:hypothetical protein